MDLFEEIVKLRREGKRAALATIVHTNGSIPSYESSRMLVREDGSIAGTIGGGCVEADVWAAAREVMRAEAPRKMIFNLNNEASYDNGLICGGTLEVFVEPILPQPALYIFGGGHVSTALALAAHTAGFAIGMIDDREQFANAERFPMAREIYTSFDEAFAKLQPNASTYIVIVTRGHKDDMRVLGWAAQTDAALHRHDRQQAQSNFGLRCPRKRRHLAGKTRTRVRSRRTRHRRAHARRNRHQHHRRTNRSPAIACAAGRNRSRQAQGRATRKAREALSVTSCGTDCTKRFAWYYFTRTATTSSYCATSALGPCSIDERQPPAPAA